MRQKIFCPYCSNQLITIPYEGRNRLFCKKCDEPLYENPVPATCLLVIDKKEKLLLVKRNIEPKKGYWCLPGGFIELGETPEQSALRELKEETGLTGQIDRLFGVLSNSSSLYNTVILICYLVTQYSGELVAGDDAEDIGYFDPNQLPEIAFESHARFINDYYRLSGLNYKDM